MRKWEFEIKTVLCVSIVVIGVVLSEMVFTSSAGIFLLGAGTGIAFVTIKDA